MAKKYYAGKKQANGEYAYIAELHPGFATETTILENAIAYDNAKDAQNLAVLATFTSNEAYSALEIETTIKEI